MQIRQEVKVMKAIFSVLFVGFLMAAILVPMSAMSDGAPSCDLTFFNGLLLPNTAFTVAQPQTSPADHCEVIGKINPRTGVDGKAYAIGFHLRLPDAWKQRFYFQGGGGTDGTLGDAMGNGALAAGYAVVSTDAGHDNTLDYDSNAGGTAAFGVDPQARIDYGYNALDQVTQTAKHVISKYYPDATIAYSYFVGCSNGGRQGMIASQRFPTYFDGIIAGSPGFDLPKAAVAEAWNEQVLAPLATKLSAQGQPYLPDTFSDLDLVLAGNAILAACDDLDGVADGIVANPDACTNDLVYPELQKIQCTGPKTASCLSAAQVTALKKIYAGVRNSHGKALYTDWQWDVGISGFTSLRLWSLGIDNPTLVNNCLNLTLGGGSLPLVFMTPPVITPVNALEAYIFHFNFDTDAPKIFQTSGIYTQSSMQFMTATATNLSPFKKRGGKMILYHGNSDGVFSPHDTINWYKAMNETMHGKAKGFARLFLVPGMGHCSAGPGTTTFDAFTALVNWVEDTSGNSAPDMILATAPPGTPWPGRTRPLCPYPEVAAYEGTGNVEVASSFVCVPPIEVRIEPETLNLKSKGEFTAFITLPDGYDLKDWNIQDVWCEGAHAVKTMISHNTYTAKFNRQDLKGVMPGDAVVLTVKATFHHDSKYALIQGTDTVRVIK